MEKSKFGIPVTLAAAIAFLLGLYGGYVITGILVGCILIREDSSWLKKAGVNVLAWMLLFSLASTVINLIPNILDIIQSAVSIVGGSFYLSAVTSFFSFLSQILSLGKTVMFILMAVMALGHKTILLPGISKLFNN